MSELPDAETTGETPHIPPIGVRYRCAACGNLTRFDVRVTRTTVAYHHYSVGGELEVEDERVLAESIEDVSCRWCASSAGVEELGAVSGSD